MTLQNNITTLLATGTHIPAGDVSQVRLILGNNNTLMLRDSTVVPLKIPSSEQSGVKINVHGRIPPNGPLVIVLDFDAGKSIVNEGNGSYSIKPVISVKSVQ